MDAERKQWNERQKTLRQRLESGEHQAALDLFLIQHAMVHAAEMSHSDLFSFADQLWPDMTEEAIRRIPQNCNHSVAWNIWHLARIEDVTMNLLVAGSPQLFYRDDWLNQLRFADVTTGNGMSDEHIAQLSIEIDLDILWRYRLAVGRRTREIVQQLTPEALKEKVNPARLQQVKDQGAIIDAARAIADYWARRTIAGLLLMPPTRHNFVHLNESLRLKQRRS
ncbi:MAG: DinB family protein [Anaerolineae bacterium]|nr:DinB family protein [Anaerolineae bacterium]